MVMPRVEDLLWPHMADDPATDAYLNGHGGLPIGFILGLDLGQRRDHSALIVNEKRVMPDGSILHAIRFSRRWKLGTEFSTVARETAEIIAELPARPEAPVLWADATGYGGPVMETLREQNLSPYEVTLTGGADWSLQPGKRVSLPKAILSSTLSVVLQNKLIAIAHDLPHLDQLVRELSNYRVRSTAAGADSFGSRTEADHDDMVIALGLAVFGTSRNMAAPRVFAL